MAGKVAGIMARRVRADIGRLAAAMGRDPGTAGNFGSERLVPPVPDRVVVGRGEDVVSGFVW